MIALILAGGEVHAKGRWLAKLPEASLVIAADGGLRHAKTLGVTPDLLIGDFDSVTQQDRDAWPGLPSQVHPTDKDALDLELALDVARERGATDVWIVGAFGGRLDQTLAAAFIGMRLRATGERVAFLDGRVEMYPLQMGDCWQDTMNAPTILSLLALSDTAVVSVEGAEYSFEELELVRGTGQGVSNRAEGQVVVDVVRGTVILILVFDADRTESTSIDDSNGVAQGAS